MLKRLLPLLFLPALLPGASEWVRVRTTDGVIVEGTTPARAVGKIPFAQILSVLSGAPASPSEDAKITADLGAVQGTDRAARDKAV